MQTYINEKLFKPFKIKKINITPELTDDWKIKLNTKSIDLISEKLNVVVPSISYAEFLKNAKEQKITIRNGEELVGTYIIGSDKKLYSKNYYDNFIKKYGDIIDGTVEEKDLELGKKYIFKNNRIGYLIAIDLVDDKPLYIFMSFEDDYEEKKKSEVCLITETSLKNLGKKTEEVIDKKYYKYALSAYLNNNSSFFNSELKKNKKIVEVYKDCKFIDKNYFEVKNWYRSVSIYNNYKDFKTNKTSIVFVGMNLNFVPTSVFEENFKYNYQPENYCDKLDEFKNNLEKLMGNYATDGCISENIKIKNDCIYYDIYDMKKNIPIVKNCKIQKLNVYQKKI